MKIILKPEILNWALDIFTDAINEGVLDREEALVLCVAAFFKLHGGDPRVAGAQLQSVAAAVSKAIKAELGETEH